MTEKHIGGMEMHMLGQRNTQAAGGGGGRRTHRDSYRGGAHAHLKKVDKNSLYLKISPNTSSQSIERRLQIGRLF